MFGSDLIVGGRRIEDVERALQAALPTLDLVVVERATVTDGRARFDLVSDPLTLARTGAAIEAPSIAFGALGDGLFTVDVRGPRSPLWHLGLAQRLSYSLQGWAAVRVSDRLYDNYGHGFFFCGYAVEGAMRAGEGLATRFGGDARVANSVLYAQLDEDDNNHRFEELAARVAGKRSWRCWPPTGEIRVLLVATNTIDDSSARAMGAAVRGRSDAPDPAELPWLVYQATPKVVGILAGLTEEDRLRTAAELRAIGVGAAPIDLDPSYEVLPGGLLDEEATRVLLFCDLPPVHTATILGVVAKVSCSGVIAELGALPDPPATTWSCVAGAPFVQVESRGIDALAQAWKHVTARTRMPMMAWTFDHERHAAVDKERPQGKPRHRT